MKKTIAFAVVLLALIAGVLYYALQPRQQSAGFKPEDVKTLSFDQLYAMSAQCEKGERTDHCTLILEAMAMKAQHAKRGERFWMHNMARLGEWYVREGKARYVAGQELPEEYKKALDLYDWILKNKPAYGDRALYGKASLQLAVGDAGGADKSFARLQRDFPSSTYASKITEARLGQ